MEAFLCIAIVAALVIWWLISGTGPDSKGKIK
jgi:hypothetical protein